VNSSDFIPEEILSFIHMNTDRELQRRQLVYQIDKHSHSKNVPISISLSKELSVEIPLVVYPGVPRPDLTDSLHVARYLYYNNRRLLYGKDVVDVGCGCGVFGLVSDLCGAASVVMLDISLTAVENARSNISSIKPKSRMQVSHSDLLNCYSGDADVIIFSHPFFIGEADAGDSLRNSMVSPPGLLERFFIQCRRRLKENGIVVACRFDFVDESHDPVHVGKICGFSALNVFEYYAWQGAAWGTFSIFELTQSAPLR
jgi:SAM-dependent methyltransferase